MIDLLVSRLKVCRAALIVVAMALMPLACSCGRSEQKFRDAIQRGELSEAEQHLGNMSSGDQGEYALQLIRTYLDLDEPAKAIHVYEDITPWHSARGDLKLRPDGYSARASRLLREYLIAHDEYDKAWQYYPLEYDDENYIGNARSL